MLGAQPEAILIMATAQSQASVGMGLLAGLYLYGSHLFIMSYGLDSSFFSLTYKTVIIVASVDSGVSVDVWTSYAVRIMAISVFSFVIV
ncbi:unnamed protein product [Brassica oleracea]